MTRSTPSAGQQPNAQRFIDHFEVNQDQSTVSLNPKLCNTMGVFEQLIKDKKLRYQHLGITGKYYQAFKKQVLHGIKLSVDELTKLAGIGNIGDRSTDHQMDYNLLDYLEGLIKSAVENNLISWRTLSFKDIDEFNDTLDSVRGLIDLSAKNDFLETTLDDEAFSELLLDYEGDGKMNGDVNLFDDDQIVRDSDLRERILGLTDKRISNPEQEVVDDSDYEILKKYASAIIIYLPVHIPDLKSYDLM